MKKYEIGIKVYTPTIGGSAQVVYCTNNLLMALFKVLKLKRDGYRNIILYMNAPHRYKTIRKYLESLPEGWMQDALSAGVTGIWSSAESGQHIKNPNLDTKVCSLSSAIANGCNWAKSTSGVWAWRKLHAESLTNPKKLSKYPGRLK